MPRCLSQSCRARDLWEHTDLGALTGTSLSGTGHCLSSEASEPVAAGASAAVAPLVLQPFWNRIDFVDCGELTAQVCDWLEG